MGKSAASPPTEAATPRAKACCLAGAANVTGADIVRIARTLVVDPWQFTQTAPAAAGDPDSVVVDKGRRRVNLKLATAAHGCVFRLPMPSGASWCGLGDLAPISCRVFPVDPSNGGRGGETRPGSPTAAPVAAATAPATEPADGTGRADQLDDLLQQAAADQAHWREIVTRWNRLGAVQHPKAPVTTIEDFQRYLLEAQVAREAGTGWPEEVQP
jgi:hypothetical protein